MPSTRRSGRHCAIAQIALARFRHPPVRRLRAAQLARAGRLSYHAVRRRLDARTNTRYAHTPHVCAVPGASRLPRAPCRSCDATATAAHTRRANPRHPAPARCRSRHAGYCSNPPPVPHTPSFYPLLALSPLLLLPLFPSRRLGRTFTRLFPRAVSRRLTPASCRRRAPRSASSAARHAGGASAQPRVRIYGGPNDVYRSTDARSTIGAAGQSRGS